MTTTCARCGADAPGAFCGACGARIEPARDAPAPREVQRPKPSPFVTRVDGSIPEGSTIGVDAGDQFLGLRFGACSVVLGAGTHETTEELDEGWYVLEAGVEIGFEEPLGILEDNRGARARVSIRGASRVRIDEPRDAVVALVEQGRGLDVPALSSRVRAKVKDLVEGEIRDLLAQDRYFSALQSQKAIDGIRDAVRDGWAADPEREAWLAMELAKLQVDAVPIEEAPAEPEKPRVELVPEGTRVDVAWADGGRYAGVVRAAAYLVAFDDGQQHWVPVDTVAALDEPEE